MKVLRILCLFLVFLGIILAVLSGEMGENLSGSKVSYGVSLGGSYVEQGSGYIGRSEEGMEMADSLQIVGMVVSVIGVIGVIGTTVSIQKHRNDPVY